MRFYGERPARLDRHRGSAAALRIALSLGALVCLAGCQVKPVATVNGTSLSEKDFGRLCETSAQIRPQAGTVGFQVLVQWIRSTMLAQEARKLGVYPSQKELDDRLEAFRRQVAFTGGNFEDGLRAQGLTLENFKRDLLNTMVNDNVFYRGVEVSDDDLKKEFDRGKKFFSIPEQIQMSQITVDSAEKLKEVQSGLATATNFALLAQTHSKDMFAQSGGMVPQMLQRQAPKGGPVPQQALDAAFKLKEGQVTEPVKVGATWVIVRVDKKIERKDPRLEDVRELIKASIREKKAQESGRVRENQRGLAQSMQSAKVEVFREEYKGIVAQLKQTQAGAPPPGAAAVPSSGSETPPPPPGG